MFDCLQNKTFLHRVDKYYFNSLCEIAARLLEKGLFHSCDSAIASQPCVTDTGL